MYCFQPEQGKLLITRPSLLFSDTLHDISASNKRLQDILCNTSNFIQYY